MNLEDYQLDSSLTIDQPTTMQPTLDESSLSLYGGATPTPPTTNNPYVPTSTQGNNNPLNIRTNPDNNWQGMTDNSGDFVKFESNPYGIRAGGILLSNYAKKGINTLEGAITRFAPPNENDTSNYVNYVSKQMGIDPKQTIDLNDPEIQSKLLPIMAKMESGKELNQDDLMAGLELAKNGSSTSSSPRPTIQNVLAHKTKQTNYSEENIPSNSFLPMTNTQDMLKQRFQDIHTKQPQDRANLGAKLGAGIGMRNGGLAGGLLGAAIGAFAGRALGQITSGEQAKQAQLQTTTQDLHNLGIAKGNFVTFKDGGEFPLDLNMKLTNVDTVTNPNKTRTVYEIDRTNPLTNRTVALVTPLAQIIASKNKQGRATNESIAMLVNMVQAGALNIEQVKQRVREMTFKLGLSKQELSALGDLYNG